MQVFEVEQVGVRGGGCVVVGYCEGFVVVDVEGFVHAAGYNVVGVGDTDDRAYCSRVIA